MPKGSKETTGFDVHIGNRLRERRTMLGLTQQQLAELVGVTYQQAHKYERGINRVSASRLYQLARILSVPLTYFFEGIGSDAVPEPTLHHRMLLEISRNFLAISDFRQQEAISQLVRALAEPPAAAAAE